MSDHHEQSEPHHNSLEPHESSEKDSKQEVDHGSESNVSPGGRRRWPSFRKRWRARLPEQINKKPALALALLLVGVVILVVGAYLIFGRAGTSAGQATARPALPTQTTPTPTTSQPSATAPTSRQDHGLFDLFGGQSSSESEQMTWYATAASITLKLALAGLLAALLAFRPHKEIAILQRNPYVAQTQILLAIVAAALMMIVADNAARAFGIFAAASLVRFRTNIRDPKEITVLLMSLAIGLASGVGKIEVAIVLSIFSLLVLSVLEYYEPQEIFRAMELTVTSRRVDETDQMLRELFEKRNMTSELRKVDREDPENPTGKIVYYVNVNGHVSTDQLSEEIFTSDPDNIDSIQWDQKKSSSYVYR